MSNAPTERFSSRVADYVRARPSYPQGFLDFLRDDLKLRPSQVVADVGSGTGILTRALLPVAGLVHAVEPNADMRGVAERELGGDSRFKSVAAIAEATTLLDASVDMVVAAQAFHWFDRERAKKEFRRILKPGGYVVLVWNERLTDRPAFSVEYEGVVRRYASDLDRVRHHTVTNHDTPALAEFFAPGGYRVASFSNHQDLDFDRVVARVASSSYMPLATDPKYPAMIAELRRAFDAHQRDGMVRIEYETRAYYGRLG